MTNDITNAGDGFGVAENSSNTFIVGKMIKFLDGEYIVDKTETLPADTQLVAIGTVTAWVKWGRDECGNSRPLEHRVTREGQIHADRDDLPDQDDSVWEPGLNGEPADPWRDSRYLRLIDPRTGGDFTFVTDSFGGRRAVGNLKSQTMNVRMAYPDAVPVLKLGSAPFKTSYGLKKRPDFKVVGWRNRNGSRVVEDDPTPPKLEQLKRKEPEFDDEIPFA